MRSALRSAVRRCVLTEGVYDILCESNSPTEFKPASRDPMGPDRVVIVLKRNFGSDRLKSMKAKREAMAVWRISMGLNVVAIREPAKGSVWGKDC
eukprot:1354635-Amorphochlora_amoeboformis.AAC.1